MPTKPALHLACLAAAESRTAALRAALASLQESMLTETKSSAGDKHETARSLMQIEENKLRAQLQEALNLQSRLVQINTQKSSSTVQSGSLVFTNKGVFYLAVAIGKIKLEEQTYFCISTDAPIAQKMLGLSVGDGFVFNGLEYKIEGLGE